VSCLYHLCAADFRGTVLYPLNGLRGRFPDLYRREKAKFAGREPLLTYIVPGLGVAWADTVNLSVLDPRLLIAERRRMGIPFSRLLERRLVCIPAARVQGLPAVCYTGRSHWINSSPGDTSAPLTPPDDEFSRFDISRHVEPPQVPALHRKYLSRQKARGELALGFVFVPHVLVASSIDISGLEFIALEPPPHAGA
jgi:hypothetical protein